MSLHTPNQGQTSGLDMVEGYASLLDAIKREITTARTRVRTIPVDDRDALKDLIRDPYVFEFLDGAEELGDRDLESRLLLQIERFLMALGAGFAFAGKQYRLLAGQEEFFIDLLFYHLGLSRFVVIELKVGKFTPEHAGKLAFYVNVVDEQLRRPDRDGPTIGILMAARRDEVVVEYALETMHSPIAVSNWSSLPEDIRRELPTSEQFAASIAPILHEDEDATDDGN